MDTIGEYLKVINDNISTVCILLLMVGFVIAGVVELIKFVFKKSKK